MTKTTIVFNNVTFLENTNGRVCIFASEQPYEVSNLNKNGNLFGFSYDEDNFEMVSGKLFEIVVDSSRVMV